MAQLTAEQITFLKSQHISLSMVFDATGLSAPERKASMTALEVPFYYGGAECAAGGHSLRTKAGHCIQCDTAKIAYQLRNSAQGYVYLAHSKSTGYIKVGYSRSHPQDRGHFLRNEAYGGVKDWDIKKIQHLDKEAGRKEFLIHARLERYRKSISYQKGASLVECREIFLCDLDHALSVFVEVLSA
ncbi:GIY-YIG nuclease family protein [Cupriavidus sp. Agwp_2]|uniref:GIY-YIG nuclease family protein n=1 Tax=Cupriavidus sp. Agwp_2 TaxID=2897324 RepID=UPI00346071CE